MEQTVLFHSSELRGKFGSHRGHVHVPIAACGYGLITWYTQHINLMNRIRAIITTIVVCRIIPGSANIMWRLRCNTYRVSWFNNQGAVSRMYNL